MMLPMVDLKGQYQKIKTEIDAAIHECLDQHCSNKTIITKVKTGKSASYKVLFSQRYIFLHRSYKSYRVKTGFLSTTRFSQGVFNWVFCKEFVFNK